MSTMYVLSVRDRATDSFGTPMFFVHMNQAIRSFSDEVNRAESIVSQHPEDFDLYLLGNFDQAKGLFYCEAPRQVAVGKDLVRSE
jgi:hypothetical protein